MGTTVWVDDDTRDALRRLQGSLGTASVNETIRRLLQRPEPDARAIFALHAGAIREIMERRGLRRLIAFGSRARGDATSESDLDLAVEIAPGADALAILGAEADFEVALGLRVNLVELPNPRLMDAIRREGVIFEP